ncbi:MAG: hypothetical protein AAF696_07290 [Bacteroidota bacterium]
MTLTISTYIIYIGISLILTILVGIILGKTGRVLLTEYFHGNKSLAENINSLLLLGYYLLNIGYISLSVNTGIKVKNHEHMFEVLSHKIGITFLVLAGFYLLDMFLLFKLRKKNKKVEDYVLSS